jgi:hypothetical protein
MLLRSLLLLCLLLLPQVSVAQSRSRIATVPDTCPVTKSSDHPFVPPLPYSANPSEGSFWYGSDRLWTFLPLNGTWGRLGHYTPDDPTFRQKLFFWRQGYDAHNEPRAKLTVTGKRIDSAAPPLLSDESHGGWRGNDSFIVTGINFPTAGCWQITGHYENDEVTFVVWLPK